MKTRAVFLDKDGTVVVNVPYNVDPNLIELMPGAVEGLLQLQTAEFAFVMISNQAGVAHGYFTESQLLAAQQRLQAMLMDAGIALQAFYYCPHHPLGSVAEFGCKCECRKPAPGMIQRAAREHGIDLAESWFFVDILDDVEAGNRAGCRTVLVDTGTEADKPMFGWRVPDHKCTNMIAAAEFVLTEEGASESATR